MNNHFVNRLCEFYRNEKRDLPWRHTKDPYKIWVSEIMLQQTRVEAVKSYYKRFLDRLPTIKDLAECPEDELLKLWEGLGYYNRVRNMQKAAVVVMEQYGGAFPSDYSDILSLPGIGEYTAGAIASIAFHIKVPAVDGNVLRVMARYEDSKENILEPAYKKKVQKTLSEVVQDAEVPGNFNQALIELGAIVCVPNGEPKCNICPLEENCLAHRNETTDVVPVRIKKQKRKIEERTILLIRSGEEAAIAKRPSKGLLAGLYEFPSLSGHVSEKEVIREIEEKGYTALRLQKLPPGKHIFSHVTWEMIGYEIRIAPPEHDKTEESTWKFVETSEIEAQYALPTAFSAYAAHLAVALGRETHER